MRKNVLEKTKYENIYTFETRSGENHFYLNFELQNKRYQRKNITRLFAVNTLKQAKIKFEEIKTMIRKGEDPFSKNIKKEIVKNIIIEQIANKKPKYEGKDNTKYKKSLEIFYNKYIDDTIGHLKFEKVTKRHVCKKRSKSDTYDTFIRTHKTVSFGQ